MPAPGHVLLGIALPSALFFYSRDFDLASGSSIDPGNACNASSRRFPSNHITCPLDSLFEYSLLPQAHQLPPAKSSSSVASRIFHPRFFRSLTPQTRQAMQYDLCVDYVSRALRKTVECVVRSDDKAFQSDEQKTGAAQHSLWTTLTTASGLRKLGIQNRSSSLNASMR